MFGVLFFERDPLGMQDLPGGILSWVQDAGGFAAAGLVLWLLLGLPRWRAVDRARVPAWKSTLFLIAAAGAGVAYLLYFLLFPFAATAEAADAETRASTLSLVQGLLLTAGGACALFAVGLPFACNVASMRWRRIWALAKLSFKEALCRRILWAFSGLLLVFLFASWFVSSKPESQVRTYVEIVFWAMNALLLFTAVVLSAFSIPADIKQQTIHTIVTKPVERFEVVLGRFLGFLGLMTLVLLFMTVVSLGYVLQEIDPEAAAESLKARVPLYGTLEFENTGDSRKGTNVGREWDYRSYITGVLSGREPPMARWDFRDVPRDLAGRRRGRCEFNFDVHRTTKGKENMGVSCAFRFRTWNFKKGDDDAYRAARRKGPAGDIDFENELAEKYGYFEVPSKEVTDFHTQFIDVPAGLFRRALQEDEQRRRELQARGITNPPLVEVRVRCNSLTQYYVGMAKYDLYLRQDRTGGAAGKAETPEERADRLHAEQRRDQLAFSANFFKGAFGLWLRLGLMIGLAVALSTYLSGVISMLITLVLYLGGECQEFIRSVATGTNAGGGPLEAMTRLARRELTGPRVEESVSAAERLLIRGDDSFRWMIRRALNVIPDVDRFNLTPYVANGFDIPGGQLLINSLLLAGYLLPWAVLAYYLIKWREVASSN
jgi:hypothetical protein